jgi:biopolymer transport protein ExbB
MADKRFVKLSMMFALLLFAFVVIAQDAIPVEQPAAPAQQTSNTTLWGLWKTGGWAMYPIGLLSVAGVGLIIFGFISTKQSRMVHLDLVPELQQRIQELDFQSVNSICSGSPSTMTNILHAGISRLSEDHLEVEAVEKAMEEAAVEENTSGLKPINYLSIIASIAPMLGLLGTVSGMIKAFDKMSFGGMGNPELLAGDIGEAMVTTAFGLLVGIPAMFFYFFLKNQFLTNMSQIGRVLGKLTHEMELAFKRAGSGGGSRFAESAADESE